MRFYRCDRCKKEYTFNKHTIDDCKLGMRNPNETALIVELPVDLCDDCRKDFEAWFRQPRMDKAMEEARAKQHAHENGDVTVIGLQDGRCICPVCGHVFEKFIPRTITFSDGSQIDRVTSLGSCPKCGSLFNQNHITYTDDYGKKGGDSDDTTGTQT